MGEGGSARWVIPAHGLISSANNFKFVQAAFSTLLVDNLDDHNLCKEDLKENTTDNLKDRNLISTDLKENTTLSFLTFGYTHDLIN